MKVIGKDMNKLKEAANKEKLKMKNESKMVALTEEKNRFKEENIAYFHSFLAFLEVFW